ncbi:c-type cytochrome [Terasakiella sp. A23]|uniref:c-type cytochrome n=1 Tax=Terasakiella sp. FCG-A23 TaxID=3080561 RepID=UPI002952BB2B|nr:c-type cytochrome [Terasakiella sp. A23]MDV7339329.1 c-type cytochrome [Terasakiella sp. A23]
MFKKTLAVLACVIGVSACQSTSETAMNDPYFGYKPPSSEAAAGIQVFHRCKKCHSMDPARNTFGPNLRGVYMRPAASLPRFDYSDSLKASGLVWDEANLRDWIKGNDMKVKGTRMRHVEITDAAEQDYLIAFLKTFK